MLQPAENHADHSLIVAVVAALLSPLYDADPADAFLAGMCHHLHNATMPDSGFTGEMLLADALYSVIQTARARAIAELPVALGRHIGLLLSEIGTDQTAVARAFHAADVLDRVLEIEHHLTGASLTMGTVLGDYELVHAGPVKAFQDAVLAQAGLA